MADIHIERTHHMSLAQARQIAAEWMKQAEEKFDLSCDYVQGDAADEVQFSRPGMSGVLQIRAQRFELEAELGFLLSAFKDKIETEITKTLDRLIASQSASAA